MALAVPLRGPRRESGVAQCLVVTSDLFEEDWELIPGKFRFEVWHKDKKLCERTFTIVPDTKPKDKR